MFTFLTNTSVKIPGSKEVVLGGRLWGDNEVIHDGLNNAHLSRNRNKFSPCFFHMRIQNKSDICKSEERFTQ